MRSKVPLAAALFFVLSVSSSAPGQLVMGRVRNKQGGVPLRQIEVDLVRDTTAVSEPFARTTTDTGGVFYLDAPKAGTYRLAFVLKRSVRPSKSARAALPRVDAKLGHRR